MSAQSNPFYLDDPDQRSPLPRMLSNSGREPEPGISDFAFHVRQTLKGLGGGLVVVVPAVLWLSGVIGPGDGESGKARVPPVVISQVAIKPLAVSEPVRPTALVEKAPAAAESVAPPPPAPASSARLIVTDRLRTAKVLVSSGEILRARELLAEPALAIDPEAIYLLAETFDPNVLAALGLSNVKAEPERARRLYRQALSDGVVAARQRLDALQ
jgi:hypothetical protein